MATPNPVPQLTNYVGNAFNAQGGDFLSQPVFLITYNKGTTISWGPSGSQRNIPDQISASTATSYYSQQNSILMENQADYEREFSASLGAELSGVNFSASAQSSLLFHGDLFTSTSSTYALNFYLQSVLKFERLTVTQDSLDLDFIAAIKSLPTDISSPTNQQKYFSFFSSYGTHYATKATMGGIIVMESAINDTLIESSGTTQVNASLGIGFNAIFGGAGGNLSVETAYKSSSFLSSHRNSVRISLSAMGGVYTPNESLSNWVTSIYNTPTIFLNVPFFSTSPLISLASISTLASIAGASATIGTNIDTLIPVFMAQGDTSGLLSTPQTSIVNTVYNTLPFENGTLQTGAGFIISCVRKSGDGSGGFIQNFDDPGGDPTTMRANASQHYYTNAGTLVPAAASTMPCPYQPNMPPTMTSYTSRFTGLYGPASTPSFQFVGFSNTGAALGEWQQINLGIHQPYTASTDGFVVAYADWNQVDGSRGQILGQQLDTTSGKYTTIAGASQHYYSKSDTHIYFNSFCMPIRQNTTYQLNYQATAGQPTAQAFFVSLGGSVKFFSAFASRTANQVYQSQTDGFLIAYLYKTQDEDQGSIDLYTYPDQPELTNSPPLASTSIHYSPNNDTYVPYNTAMIPVSKLNYYTVQFSSTGSTGVSIFWMPLGSQQNPG